jgi:hypothetical protein
VSFVCLFTEDHMMMQNICYVLGAVGILLAIYFLATSEALGIPIFLIGLVHIGFAAKASHAAMQVGCTGLAAVSMVAGLLMLTTLRAPARM